MSTLDPSAVQIKGWYNDDIDRDIVNLTAGAMTSADGTRVVVTFSAADLNSIKRNVRLCSSPGLCYIRFSSDFVEDMAGNDVAVLADDVANRLYSSPTSIVEDTTGTKVQSFDLNLETGELTVTLNEFALEVSFDPSAITLQSAFNSTTSYTLTTGIGNVNTGNNPSFVIQLNAADLNGIKSIYALAADENSTYLTATASLARDTVFVPPGGNRAVPLLNGISALQVRNYVKDETDPTAIDFVSLDLGQGTAEIKFSEPVDSNSIDFGWITLQASSSGGEASNLTEKTPIQRFL